MRLSRAGLLALIEESERLEAFAEAVERATGPADARSIVDFFDVPTADIFNVPPAQAINYFKAKGLSTTFSYADALGAAHDQAFTVAKMMDVDLLGQVRASLDSALANGTPFKEWAKDLMPTLQKAGWWGKKEVVDPLTGQTVRAQLGSPWRLETIFRTNMQSAYAAGQWEEIQSQADIAPFLLYDAVDDFRTRPMHKAWDNKLLPVSSPWWKTHYPPNGWNCRCGVIQIDAAEAKRLGLQVSDLPKPEFYNWKNPRTGEIQKIPVGLDPGFDRNSGAMFVQGLKQQLADKVATLPPTMKAAVASTMTPEQAAALAAAQRQATAEILKAEQAAAKELSAMRAKAQEAAKQLAAQDQIDLIALGDKQILGTGAQYKVKALQQLKKTDEWLDLKPTDKLAAIEAQAAKLKIQNETASKVALYKKQAIEGKTPAPGAVKAFQSLDPADQAAVVKAIDEAKAKIAAQAAAQAASEAQALAKAAGAGNPTAKTESLLLGDSAPDPANLVRYARKDKGGTPGAYYQDTVTGQRYLIKFNGSEDAVKNEVLSAKLYQLAGLDAPDLYAIELEGQWALASRLVDGIKEVGPDILKRTDSVMDGFAVDAWLANWDVMGRDFDNTVLRGGRALRIDVGGSLRYRAVGGLKGAAFGDSVTEIRSLRDAGLNPQAAQVFGGITNEQIEAGVIKVLRTSDDDIRSVVEKYGPPDATERRILADRLIARKRDLARQFPAAAARAQALDTPAATPKPARVTIDEQAEVEASRVNGYTFATDSDQIEDHVVLVSTMQRQDGSDFTRGFFKLRADAAPALMARIKESLTTIDGTQPATPGVDLLTVKDDILATIKSVNFRADKGAPLDATVVMKADKAIKSIDEAIAKMRAAASQADDAGILALEENTTVLTFWRNIVVEQMAKAKAAEQAQKLAEIFPYNIIPNRVGYAIRGAEASKETPKIWKKIVGPYAFDTADFDRSFAKLNGGTWSVPGVRVRYEGTLPDGTKITYLPNGDSEVGFAMQGVFMIDVPGKGIASTTKVFDAMDAVGLKSARATTVDRQHLYLNSFARLQFTRRASGDRFSKLAAFQKIPNEGADAVDQKLSFFRSLGLDIEKSEGWRQLEGVRQAFGHGRVVQYRPDLTDDALDAVKKQMVVYHNPNDLSHDAGEGVFEKLKVIIEGGGMLASLVDRVRRGVPLNGSSVSRDIQTGGGFYVFARLLKPTGPGTGVYWKTRALRRMDAISYDSDKFGNVSGSNIEDDRHGQNVDSLLRMTGHYSNETIFKGSMSLFDDVDRIVLQNEREVADAIRWMKSKGYNSWPDGRKLDEVIMTRAKHRASL